MKTIKRIIFALWLVALVALFVGATEAHAAHRWDDDSYEDYEIGFESYEWNNFASDWWEVSIFTEMGTKGAAYADGVFLVYLPVNQESFTWEKHDRESILFINSTEKQYEIGPLSDFWIDMDSRATDAEERDHPGGWAFLDLRGSEYEEIGSVTWQFEIRLTYDGLEEPDDRPFLGGMMQEESRAINFNDVWDFDPDTIVQNLEHDHDEEHIQITLSNSQESTHESIYSSIFDRGYEDGFAEGIDEFWGIDVITAILSAFTMIFGIELFNGITIGMIVGIPVVFTAFMFVMKLIRG